MLSWGIECEDLSPTSYCEIAGNVGLKFGQQQVARTEAVVGGTEPYQKRKEEKERLHLFRKNMYANMLYAFLDNRRLTGSDYILEGSIMQLARPDALVEIVLTCLQ